MAQSGYTPISIYYSSTATNIPTAGNLTNGELAINIADGKLYYKDSGGTVQVLATKDATSGSFTNLAYTGTLTGGTGIVNLGSGQFYKDASGNVGIGTSSPGVSLDISKAQAIIRATSTTGTNTSYLAAINTGGFLYLGREDSTGATFGLGAYSSVISSTGAYPLVTSVNGAERMRIDSSGNVGIGTSSPTTKLQVAGNVTVNAGGGNTYGQFISGSSTIQVGTNGTSQFIYGTGAVPLTFSTNSAEAMRIDSSGNVGIGTNSPSSYGKLVSYGAFGTSAPALSIVNSSAENANNIAEIQYWLGNSFSGLVNVAKIGAISGTTGNQYGSLYFSTSSAGAPTERMRIDSSGNLLVNETSSANGGKVDINGRIGAKGVGIGLTCTDGTTVIQGYFGESYWTGQISLTPGQSITLFSGPSAYSTTYFDIFVVTDISTGSRYSTWYTAYGSGYGGNVTVVQQSNGPTQAANLVSTGLAGSGYIMTLLNTFAVGANYKIWVQVHNTQAASFNSSYLTQN